MPTSISELAAAVTSAVDALADFFMDSPDSGKVNQSNLDALIELERAFNTKSLIDAAFGHAVTESRSGDLVGSTRPVDFLCKHLSISRPEALDRLRRGALNHGELEQDSDEAPRAYGRDQVRQLRISAEKQSIIDRELKRLQKPAAHLHALRADALATANDRSPEALRTWVREEVAARNESDVNKDPFAGHRNRHIVIGRPDADGGSFIRGYLPAATTSLLDAVLAPARNPGYLASVPAEEDTRGLQHRRVDALHHLLRKYHQDKVERDGGIGSIIVSLSIKDFQGMKPTSRFPTNTHSMLTPMDVLQLGAAEFDFGVVHNPDTGRPLHLGRTHRTATMEQRIALMAAELVCTHPECEQPMSYSDVHHIVAWAQGGTTDIENLTLMCRSDHVINNDTPNKRHGKRGQAEYDPETGRVGYRPPTNFYNPDPQVELNDGPAQQRSAGAKIREQPP